MEKVSYISLSSPLNVYFGGHYLGGHPYEWNNTILNPIHFGMRQNINKKILFLILSCNFLISI